jgi:cytochrome d ubiquinol oxidase subunit I
MVSMGAHFSAIWIVVANSWMQTPAGYHIVGEGLHARAEITDFWAMVFNPSSLQRLGHAIGGGWLSGAFVVVSVSAYFLLRGRHVEFAKKSLPLGLLLAACASLGQLATGHLSAEYVAKYQPAKLAAFEGHYETTTWAPLYLFGWVNDRQERVQFGVAIPGMLSFLAHGDPREAVTGLREFKKEDRPPVAFIFQTYHAMIAIGMGLIAISLFSLWMWWKGRLFTTRWLLAVLVLSVFGPQLGNQFGWWSAEVGRQPWIVYNVLRTSAGLSRVVEKEAVLTSLILFALVYVLLFAVFVYLLNDKIHHGPDEEDLHPRGKLADVLSEERDRRVDL